MSEWNFMDYQSKDNLLRAVREEADAMLALAGEPGVWEAPTGAGHWQVRDIIGHLVDTPRAISPASTPPGGTARRPRRSGCGAWTSTSTPAPRPSGVRRRASSSTASGP